MPLTSSDPVTYTADRLGADTQYAPTSAPLYGLQRIALYYPDPDVCGFEQPAAGWPLLVLDIDGGFGTNTPTPSITDSDNKFAQIALKALSTGIAVAIPGLIGSTHSQYQSGGANHSETGGSPYEGDDTFDLPTPMLGGVTYDPPGYTAAGYNHYDAPGSSLDGGLSYPHDNYLTLAKQMAWVVQYLRSKASEWGLNPKTFHGWGRSSGAIDIMWVEWGPDMADPAMSDFRGNSSHLAFHGQGGAAAGAWTPAYASSYPTSAFPDVNDPEGSYATDWADIPVNWDREFSPLRYGVIDYSETATHGWAGGPTSAEMVANFAAKPAFIYGPGDDGDGDLDLDPGYTVTDALRNLPSPMGPTRLPEMGLVPEAPAAVTSTHPAIMAVMLAARLRELDGQWSGGFHDTNSRLYVEAGDVAKITAGTTSDDAAAPLAVQSASGLIYDTTDTWDTKYPGFTEAQALAAEFNEWCLEQLDRVAPDWDNQDDNEPAATMGDVDIELTKLQDFFWYAFENTPTKTLNESAPIYLYSPSITASWDIDDPALWEYEDWNGVQFPSATDAVGGAYPNFTTTHEPIWNYMIMERLHASSTEAAAFHTVNSRHAVELGIATLMADSAPPAFTSIPLVAVSGIASAVNDQLDWLLSTLISSESLIMASSYVVYEATAAQTQFVVTFPAISADHIYLLLDGVTSAEFTISEDQQILTYTGATDLAAGTLVKVYRRTPTNLVDFTDGSVLTEAPLDRAILMHSYRIEEAIDGSNAAMQVEAAGGGEWDALSKRLKNLGAPVSANDAVRLVDLQSIQAGEGGGSGLPEVTGGDNDSIFLVDNGAWAVLPASTLASILPLGSAAALDVGTGVGEVPLLETLGLGTSLGTLPLVDGSQIQLLYNANANRIPTAVYTFSTIDNGGSPTSSIARTTSATWEQAGTYRAVMSLQDKAGDDNLLASTQDFSHWWSTSAYGTYVEAPVQSGWLSPFGHTYFTTFATTGATGGTRDYNGDIDGTWSSGEVLRFELLVSARSDTGYVANGEAFTLAIVDSAGGRSYQSFQWVSGEPVTFGAYAGAITDYGIEEVNGTTWYAWIEVTEDGSFAVDGNTRRAQISINSTGLTGAKDAWFFAPSVTSGTGRVPYTPTAVCKIESDPDDLQALSLAPGAYQIELDLVYQNADGAVDVDGYSALSTNRILPQVYIGDEDITASFVPYFQSPTIQAIQGYQGSGTNARLLHYSFIYKPTSQSYLTVRVADYDAGSYTDGSMQLVADSYVTIRKVG